MSKSGSYRVIDGKLVKVSDKIPGIAKRIEGVYFRRPYFETFNGRDAVWIESKEQKKQEMERRGLSEYNDFNKNPEPTEKRTTLYSFQNQKNKSRSVQKPEPIPAEIKPILDQKQKLLNY